MRATLEGKITGNICYCFSFSTYDESRNAAGTAEKAEDKERAARSAIRKRYPDAVFDDDRDGDRIKPLRELRIERDFLHGQSLPFPCFRVVMPSYELKMDGFDVYDSCVYMSVFPESDTAHVFVCLSVRDGGADDFTYFRHVQGNGRKLQNKDGRELSVREIFAEVGASLERPVEGVEETYLLEIKKFGDYEDVQSILDEHGSLVYGITCGDEGWRSVPASLAKERMNFQWGSRNFTRLVTFGSNSVFFNLSGSREACSYVQNRKDFDGIYYNGDVNPYFLIDSNTAGVNHGIIFSLEMVLVIKTICGRVIHRQAQFYANNRSLNFEIQKIKAYRGELIVILNKVENLQISEIGELERVLLRSYDIEPVIEKIKYLLEILESELELLYQNSTNRLINVLTVLGLVLAAMQVMQGIFG